MVVLTERIPLVTVCCDVIFFRKSLQQPEGGGVSFSTTSRHTLLLSTGFICEALPALSIRSHIIPTLLQAIFPIGVPGGITTGMVKVNELPGAMLAVIEIFALLGKKALLQVFAGRLQAAAVVGHPVL